MRPTAPPVVCPKCGLLSPFHHEICVCNGHYLNRQAIIDDLTGMEGYGDPMNTERWQIAATGEIELAERYGYHYRKPKRGQDDGGYDQISPIGTIDVKTKRRGSDPWLHVKPIDGADIFVLALQTGDLTAALLGWLYHDEAKAGIAEPFKKGYKPSHHTHVKDIRAIETLDALHFKALATRSITCDQYRLGVGNYHNSMLFPVDYTK